MNIYINSFSVRGDRGIKTLADLKGKIINIMTPANRIRLGNADQERERAARQGRRIDNLWIRIDFTFNFWRCLFPGDIFVVSSQFEPEIVEEMRSRMLANTDQLLQAMQESEALADKFKDASFTAANDADYDMIREVYKAIGQEEYLK
jgi:hypothetical protein